MASIRVFKCFKPLEVIASGNSAILFFLNNVTFLTSKKHFLLLLVKKKSNRVFSPNFFSGAISLYLDNLPYL